MTEALGANDTDAGGRIRLGPYLISTVILWTFAVSCIFWWGSHEQRDNVDNSARNVAKALCERYMLSIDRSTMTGEAHEMEREEQGRWGHVTSLNPINKTNAPDPWEAECLRAFETGTRERSSEEVLNEQPYLRYMRPLKAEKRCLVCHESQGYSEGMCMGGISVSVPLDSYLAAASAQGRTTALGYGAIWIAGLLGIGFGGKRLRKGVAETERSQRALRQSEERYRKLFRTSRDAIMTLGPPSWQFTSGNPACVAMFETQDEARFTSLGPWDLSPESQPDGRPSDVRAKEMIEGAMREGSRFFEWTHKRLGGREFPATVLLTRVEVGGHAFLQATVRDITGQKQMEETLRASEEKFRQIVDNVGIGVSMIGTDMQILELNRQMRVWFPSISVQDHPVCHRAFNAPPLDRPCSYCPTIQTLRDGKVHEAVTATPQVGGTRNYRIVSSPIHDPGGRVVAAIEMVEDMTDKVRLERELNQAQKLEAVGRLAAGIAHEINTPIQYIGDNIEFLQIAYEGLSAMANVLRQMTETSSGEPPALSLIGAARDLIEDSNLDYLTEQVPRAIEQSIEGVDRVSTIVQAMKEFSHPGGAERTSVDLNQCIRSTVTVSRNEWKYVADLELDLDDALPLVLCLPGDFNQAILNMIVNAAHAIGDVVGDGAEHKGKITVSTRPDGDWVEIRIADTGSGIPEEIREHVFDPFFTTKAVGHGTGQGLSVVHNVIVQKHRGTVSLESEVAKGTTFTVRLPIAPPRTATDRAEPDESGAQREYRNHAADLRGGGSHPE